ncbi:MAG: monovalent cation/H+ antiporter subunit D family protein [Longimicrobiales bacterium]|nr:monovalent cation/H+ antiporter subunit D family protein [Longimicrobiales bacterium]
MTQHLPALLVVVPLMAAPVASILKWGRAAWGLALAVSWSVLAMALLILGRVMDEGTISYFLGGWAAPIGIEYRIDLVNAWVLVIVAAIGAVVMPYARASLEREIEPQRIPLIYSALLLCLTGLLGITVTGDVFNLFVFLEISSISAYALIASGPDRRALHAAYKYLIMGSIGATFIVIGIGMMYVMTGTLNMMDLAERLPNVSSRTVSVAFAFLTVGISLKLALFPLHLWLPDAYTFAPSTVTAFLASTATKVAVYMLVRFFFTIFGPTFSLEVMGFQGVLLPLALIAILSASTAAIYQRNVKRLLAYSSVAQIGYMILGISLASVTGLTAALLHLFNHAIMKAALFMAMGAVMYRVGSVRIEAMRGLGRRMPWTMAAFLLGGLSLIGVPGTVGFISKWYLVLAAVQAELWIVAALVLVGSLMAVVYIWRVVEAAYFHEFVGEAEVREAPLSLLIPIWILVAANIYFGLNSSATAGIATRAAEILLGAAS